MVGVPVDADDRALIAAEDHAVPVAGIDPQLVIVVAAWRSLERLAGGFPAVARAIDAGVRDVDEIGIFRIDDDLAEVPAAAPDALVARGFGPRRAGIVGPEQAAVLCVDDRIDARATGRRDGDADAADGVGRQPARQLLPVRAAVGRLVHAAARPVGRRVDAPRRTTRVPQRGVDGLRLAGIAGVIVHADVV